MQEPEVSLQIAINYIQNHKTDHDITVSIDGAHIKTKNTIHFDLVNFMHEKGYIKCDSNYARWQGVYQTSLFSPRIIVSSQPGVGDITITLNDGRTLFIESKKFKGGNSGEYPAMREAIGQLMTSCPDRPDVIPVVAVPHTAKSEELARKWSANDRIRRAGICFILVQGNGNLTLI